MLVVRIVLLLLLGRAILGRSLFAESGSGGVPEGDAEAAPKVGAESAPEADADPGQPLPDNARRRTPSLIRLAGTLAPVAGVIGFAVAVAGFMAQNTGWELPMIGAVVGDWPLAVLLITIALWAIWLLW